MTVNARYIICDLVRGNEISASLNPLKPDPCSALITVIIHPEKSSMLEARPNINIDDEHKNILKLINE